MRTPNLTLTTAGIILALCGGAHAAPPVQQAAHARTAGQVVEDCVLSISTDRAKYAAGDPITLTASIKNVSGHVVYLPDYLAPLSYEINVISPEAKEAPKSLYYEQLQHGQRASFRFIALKPDQTATEALNLGRLFDMSLEGAYKLSAKRIIGKNGGIEDSAMVRSNSVAISVVEEDDKFYEAERTPK